MLYLSIALIVSGIFFIIYTVLVSLKKEGRIIRSGKSPELRMPSRRDDNVFKKSGYNLHDEKIDKTAKKREKVPDVSYKSAEITENKNIKNESGYDLIEEIETNTDIIDDVRKDDVSHKDFSVVLYEDSSNIIDYDKNGSRIDLSLGQYKKIKRIGPGTMAISGGGLTFKAGKKQFRFDFQRASKIKVGNNFVAILLMGSNVTRLFLFNKKSNLGSRIEQVYNKHLSNVL